MSDDSKQPDDEKPVTDTLQYGVSLSEREAQKFGDWRIKELGLQLTLFGLAETQAKRIRVLSNAVHHLEEEVFRNENIKSLDPGKLINLYKIGTESLSEASSYVQKTINSLDWSTIEGLIIQLQNESGDNEDLSNSDLVSRITQELISKLNFNTNTDE